MFYSKALLSATYKGGTYGERTEAHEKAEHHRFKTDILFKSPKIPKDPYVLRLIQHFVILKAIENQLQNLPAKGKKELSAFFALSYLEDLWRTPGIEEDLQQLGVNPLNIPKAKVAQTTNDYLKKLEQLPPKALLAHFLTHVAGFMHGGSVIRSRYIAPSNRLTAYQIPLNQYDFSAAASSLSSRSAMVVYSDMMEQVDKIALDEEEYQDVFKQCTSIYETMINVYDDLCAMHMRQLRQRRETLTLFGVSLLALAWVVKLMSDYLTPSPSQLAPGA